MLKKTGEKYVITGVDYRTYSGRKHHLEFRLMESDNLKRERIFSSPHSITKEIVLDILVEAFKATSDPIVSISKLYTENI